MALSWTWKPRLGEWCCACSRAHLRTDGSDRSHPRRRGFYCGCAVVAEYAADVVAAVAGGAVVRPADGWPDGRMSREQTSVPSSRWIPTRGGRRCSLPMPSCRSTYWSETRKDYGGTLGSSLIHSRGCCCWSNGIPWDWVTLVPGDDWPGHWHWSAVHLEEASWKRPSGGRICRRRCYCSCCWCCCCCLRWYSWEYRWLAMEPAGSTGLATAGCDAMGNRIGALETCCFRRLTVSMWIEWCSSGPPMTSEILVLK